MLNESVIFDQINSDDSAVGTSGITPSGLRYVYLLENLAANGETGVYAVVLPFVTDIHLIGIPHGKQSSFGSSLRLSEMKPVQLEGDYGSFFSLYVADDEQVETRTLLDPEAMEYSIDFCSSYIWEIVNDTLYFASQGILPDMKVVDDFIQQLAPEGSKPSGLTLTPKPQVTEILSADSSTLLCPVCKVALHKGRRWLACPNGHGYLLTASELIHTRMHIDDFQRSVKSILGARPTVVTPVVVVEHGTLHCPNDDQELHKTPYQETPAFLYLCNACIYRWIDGKDLDTILGPYRNDGEDKPDEDKTI
jgi:Zn-finger nucleic acid-binding protein